MRDLRTTAERVADTKHRLATDADVWLATASADGRPYAVPLSLDWDGSRIILFTYTNSITSRNVAAVGMVRVALDGTADVVVMDGEASVRPLDDVPEPLIDSFVARSGWDPRHERAEFSLITVSPVRIDAWRSVDELEGRTIMREGRWLV